MTTATLDPWTTVPVTQKELDRLLSKTKVRLFFQKGSTFLAAIMGKLRFQWDFTIPTAATDGTAIYWNPQHFLILDDDERVTILAHELWHVAFQHMLRLMGRNLEKWNIAADHVINLILLAHGYKFTGWCQIMYKDPIYTNMSTEEVYSLLPDPPQQPQGGGSTPSPGAPQGFPVSGDILPAPANSENDIVSAVVAATHIARQTKQWGDIPGEVTQMLDKFLNPIIPWQRRLRRFFTERAESDWSYARPDRRNMSDVFVMPSELSEDGLQHLMAFEDVSGSITDKNLLRFNSEFAFIKREFDPELLTLVTFDTRIQMVKVIGRDDPFDEVKITGRGGTDLDPVADMIDKEKPSAVIIFTDMYVRPMRRLKHQPPILWVCVGNQNATVPFGELLHIPDED